MIKYFLENWCLITFVLLHTVIVSMLVPKVILQRRESGATLAWIFTIIFLPFIGLFAFWLLGTTRIRILRRKRRRAEQHLVPSLSRFLKQQHFSKDDEPVAATLYALATRLDECGPQPGCDVILYRDGGKAFDALEKAIDDAKHHIHLVYYTWEADQTGRRFRDALGRAAKRGVEVRLLIDDVGSYSTKRSFFAPLRAAGGEVARFLPLNPLTRQVSINNRNHRKIVVIDGRIAYTGSMNVGDVYAGLTEPWNDLQVSVTGRVVYELQGVFCQDWYHTTGRELATENYFPKITCRGEICTHFIASGPADERWRAIHTLIFAAINMARKRVWIETPYFVPDVPVVMALQTAALRGVDVRLLLPGHSDHPLALFAGRSFFDELLSAGVRIFEMDEVVPHAKTAIIDHVFSTAGSANMDQRSFRLNFEGNLFFFGETVARRLEKDFLNLSQDAHEITIEARSRLNHRQRLIEGVARILAPLL